MKKKHIFYRSASILIYGLAILPLYAYAQGIPERGPIPFAVYDRDNNGTISEAEFNSIREERISQRMAAGRPMRGMANAPSFSMLDQNSDGQLSKEELIAGQKAQMKKRQGSGQGGGRGMGMGMRNNMPSFSDLDLNGDGRILEKELYDARSQRHNAMRNQGFQMRNMRNAPAFSDIDLNGDGEISQKEFMMHQSQRRNAARLPPKNSTSSNINDSRQFVQMPEAARSLMRKDMLANLSYLSAIVGYLAANDLNAAAYTAETGMGKSAMGKHRGTGSPPGWYMTNEMRNLGWGMHEAASEFAEVARQGDMKNTLKALERVMSSCAACHNSYRTR